MIWSIRLYTPMFSLIYEGHFITTQTIYINVLLINKYLLMINLLIIQTSMNAKVTRRTTVDRFVSICQRLTSVTVTKDISWMLMAAPATVSGLITSQSCHRTLLYRAYATFLEHEIELTYAYRTKLSFKLFSLILLYQIITITKWIILSVDLTDNLFIPFSPSFKKMKVKRKLFYNWP